MPSVPPQSHSHENSWKWVPSWPPSVNIHLYALTNTSSIFPRLWMSHWKVLIYSKMDCQQKNTYVEHCGTGERNVSQVWECFLCFVSLLLFIEGFFVLFLCCFFFFPSRIKLFLSSSEVVFSHDSQFHDCRVLELVSILQIWSRNFVIKMHGLSFYVPFKHFKPTHYQHLY